MQELSARTRTRLRQAQRVANNNKQAAAAMLYRELLDDEPELVEAWMGLARVTSDREELTEIYARVLEIEPENQQAARKLAALEAVDQMPPMAEESSDGESDAFDPFADARAFAEEAFGGTKNKGQGEPPDPEPGPKSSSEPVPVDASSHSPGKSGVIDEQTELFFCVNHPKRETGLRCNRCERPVCSDCVELTPVGYRCKQCLREQESIFYNATIIHYVIALLVAAPLSLLGAYISLRIGFLFVLFLGGVAGTIIGRLTFRLAGRRRGRYLPHLVAGTIVVAGLAMIALTLGRGLISVGLFTFLAAGAAFYQMR
jgi:hypothetical protein